MELLTRAEEYVLLAIWILKDEAYSAMIQRQICRISGETWSLGTIYAPLERLEKRGMVSSYESESVPSRGGRRRRIYKLESPGKKALRQVKQIQESFWNILPDLAPEVES